MHPEVSAKIANSTQLMTLSQIENELDGHPDFIFPLATEYVLGDDLDQAIRDVLARRHPEWGAVTNTNGSEWTEIVDFNPKTGKFTAVVDLYGSEFENREEHDSTVRIPNISCYKEQNGGVFYVVDDETLIVEQEVG